MNDDNLYQIFIPFDISPTKEMAAEEELCIWCKMNNRKNVSHIISRKLLKSNQPNNYLKHSVCCECNSKFSEKCEDWLFKYTPIATWSQTFFGENNLKNLRFIPNFVFQDSIGEWLVINHDFISKSFLPLQIIYNSNKFITPVFNYEGRADFISESIKQHNAFCYKAKIAIEKKQYNTYVSDLLPVDFNPRVFLYKNDFIIISKSQKENDDFVKAFLDRFTNDLPERSNLKEFNGFIEGVTGYHIHYRWSVRRYIALCTKIAFELLALYEGANYCLSKDFDGLRRQVLNNINKDDYTTIQYIEGKGYRTKHLMPAGWIVANDINIKELDNMFSAPLFLNSKNCHSIIIYQVGHYLCCTVKIFNIELVQLVLGRVSTSIKFWYATVYDYTKDNLIHLYSDYKDKTFTSADNIASALEECAPNYTATAYLNKRQLRLLSL